MSHIPLFLCFCAYEFKSILFLFRRVSFQNFGIIHPYKKDKLLWKNVPQTRRDFRIKNNVKHFIRKNEYLIVKESSDCGEIFEVEHAFFHRALARAAAV